MGGAPLGGAPADQHILFFPLVPCPADPKTSLTVARTATVRRPVWETTISRASPTTGMYRSFYSTAIYNSPFFSLSLSLFPLAPSPTLSPQSPSLYSPPPLHPSLRYDSRRPMSPLRQLLGQVPASRTQALPSDLTGCTRAAARNIIGRPVGGPRLTGMSMNEWQRAELTPLLLHSLSSLCSSYLTLFVLSLSIPPPLWPLLFLYLAPCAIALASGRPVRRACWPPVATLSLPPAINFKL